MAKAGKQTVTSVRTVHTNVCLHAWPAARNGIVRLFSLHGLLRPAVVRAQLDGGAALVELASQPDLARKGLASLWELELALLLKEDPAAETDLRQLIAEIGAALAGQSHRRCAG